MSDIIKRLTKKVGISFVYGPTDSIGSYQVKDLINLVVEECLVVCEEHIAILLKQRLATYNFDEKCEIAFGETAIENVSNGICERFGYEKD